MATNMRSIVQQLVNAGHEVKFKVRTDGGIRITSIDGVKYTGSTGNTVARTIAGTKISERRQRQLERISKQRKKAPQLTDEETKLLRKAQRELRKHGKHKETVKKKTYLAYKKKYGAKRAQEALQNDILWAKGLVYRGQAEALIERLNVASTISDNPSAFKSIAEKVDALSTAQKLSHSQLNEIYELLYEYEQGQIDDDEFITGVINILR